MKDFNIIFTPDLPPLLPDGTYLGTVGEHNAVQLVMTLPAEMVDDMTCHTVTIGGVESARIKENQQSVDGAFRVGRMIFFPLSSTYTTQRITDLTVTAYRLDGGQMVVVDKTPTIYGLTFDDGSPAPVPGGIVSELVQVAQRVDDLDDEVQALAEDVPTSEEIEAWNEAAAERHTHLNKEVLDKFSETSGNLLFDGSEVGGIQSVQRPSDLRQDAQDGSVAVAVNDDNSNSKGMYVKLGSWKRTLLDEPEQDDVTLLGLTTYENLVIRDEVLSDSIQDVPVFACGDIYLGGQLIGMVDANDNYIALNDIDDADGLPVRYIKTNFDGTIKVWFPVATSPVSSMISYPQGWSEGGVSTTAPSFAGFTPTHIDYKNTSYTDLTTIPAVVKSALRSLSQCINVSKEAMGSIYIPEDSVARFNGTIETNRKYYFNTDMDFALDLPAVPFTEEDTQFAIYLKTGHGVDMALPSDVLVSGEIDTNEGNHKVIGCYDKTVNKWCIGCVDYEVAE